MSIIKSLGVMLVLYILDVLVWGSILGGTYALADPSSTMVVNDTTIGPFWRGMIMYILMDSIYSKFRRHYKDAEDYKG